MASNDPAFEEKAAGITALYMDPPQHAAVFFVDYRHGRLSLHAALDVKTGTVHGKTASRHTSADFIGFVTDIVERNPAGKEIHIVAEPSRDLVCEIERDVIARAE